MFYEHGTLYYKEYFQKINYLGGSYMKNLEHLFNFFYIQIGYGQNKTNEKEHPNEIQFLKTEPSMYTLRE